jgi:CheY-like chemotaxis protein
MQKVLTLLLADDDPDDLQLLQEALNVVNPQHILQYVDNGDKLFQASKTHQPDIIFLDINMPGLDGPECLKQLKADDEVSVIPVVMYSSSSAYWSFDECYQLGAARYLIKPVTYSGIFKGLEVVLDLYRSNQLVRPHFDEFVIDTYKMK